MNINLPAEVQYIIDTLEAAGYEAYVVGGCVRDSLMGIEPKDWDICTPAHPEQTMKVFEGQGIIETGLKHGTITLVLNHQPFEITTYRVDGSYSDNRRPDEVKFVNVLKRDLARRDFTINALSYNPMTGLVDYYGGQQDLSDRKIKCVGNPDKRFQEDALRIMRALRFAAVFGFEIESSTADSIRKNKELLRNIAVERIAVELNKLLIGRGAGDILRNYVDVLSVIIPELQVMVGFQQNNPYHHLDVWEHTVTSIVNAPLDPVLRLIMLFHDIAKPASYTEADGIGHFYGHPQVSSDMAKEILTRLKYDNDTIDTVVQLVLYHDAEVELRLKIVRRWLSRIGEQRLRLLLEVKRADAMAQSELHRYKKLSALDNILPLIDEIIEQQQCFSLKDLAVNGRDLIAAGITEGVLIGKILNRLLEMVIDELAENERDALLRIAKYLKEGFDDE